ncbi:MAG TPA: SDR family NAD(P)-dependent oxidoreductase [Streptosporangiaceae bacterium]|jgi:NAD(P)-dependent dehydrogenase (short-subunit alcohol dehydrogenase family)|nr:SDR family NAD(P)-dependent oxidoreductase [Streptosporangiaceae bacterium]
MSRTWFITGAAHGFGREWAEAALARGDQVAATARRPEELADLAERYGLNVLPVRLDVTDQAGVFRAVQQTAAHFGSLDVVVNNAGYGHFGMVEELSDADVRDQLETNFFGALWVTQAALPIMRRQRSGRILQVTSEGGVRAFPGIGAYHASKWALEGLSQSLAQEVAGFGIHITMIEPGPYSTGWLETGSRRSDEYADYQPVREGIERGWVRGDPAATRAAILKVADADQPPLRIFFGQSLDPVAGEYEQRLATWREWEPVSIEAFG